MMELTDFSDESIAEHQRYLRHLEESTDSFLQTLEAWRIRVDVAAPSLPDLSVVTQSLVAEYVRAYELGMNAAHDVSIFAALAFSTSRVEYAIITRNINQNLTERKSAIAELESFATKSRTKSEEGLKTMRELRRKVEFHLNIMRSTSGKEDDEVTQDKVGAFFKTNLSILVPLAACLDWYIKWWTKTETTLSYQEMNIAQYSRHGGDLRLRGVQLQWKNLKNVFSFYEIKMKKLQEQHSEIFKLFHNLKPSAVSNIPTSEEPPPGPNFDDPFSAPTIYSVAPSSMVTDYGFFYTRRAFDSIFSSWSRGSHGTLQD